MSVSQLRFDISTVIYFYMRHEFLHARFGNCGAVNCRKNENMSILIFMLEHSNAPRIIPNDAKSLPYHNCDTRITQIMAGSMLVTAAGL